MVQWLGLGAFTARVRVQSLVRELRSSKPLGAAKQTNKQKSQLRNLKTSSLHNLGKSLANEASLIVLV